MKYFPFLDRIHARVLAGVREAFSGSRHTRPSRRRHRRGFTLIEIMVVIAIIGILSTAIGFSVVQWLKKAKIDATKAQLRTVSNAIDLYAADNDYPTDLRVVLDTKLIRAKQLKDPWHQPLVYTYPATRNTENAYDLCSNGPDRVEGNDDDICND